MSENRVEKNFILFIKNIWNKFGTYILSLLLLIIFIFVGVGYWNRYQEQNTLKASSAYEAMMVEYQAGGTLKKDNESLIKKGNKIMQEFPSTVYSNYAALLLASLYVSKGEYSSAENGLLWLRKHSTNTVIYTIGTQRLARIYIYKERYKEAIDLLKETKLSKSFSASNNIILADAYSKIGQKSTARLLWNEALKRTSNTDMKHLITMKINSL